MREPEASAFLSEFVRPAQRMILERHSASVLDLRVCLLNVLGRVQRWPNSLGWPDAFEPLSKSGELRVRIACAWSELGFYDANTGASFSYEVPALVGDALDDLADIAGEFENALRLAEKDAVGALSRLRFTADTHWGEHVEELASHLLRLSTSNEL